jgi:SAM-dependent methyltransferase
LVKGKKVLDIASGEGYGSFLLSQQATKVTGVDIDATSVHHAHKKYGQMANNLTYLTGSVTHIPAENATFEMVVSFETIEHLAAQDAMLAEVNRVMQKDGMFVVSTPEKELYRQRDPDNPFHIKELSFEEFSALLHAHFKHVLFFEQRFVYGSLISAKQAMEGNICMPVYHGDYYRLQQGGHEDALFNKPVFNIAVCSNQPIGMVMAPSVYDASPILKHEKNAKKMEIATPQRQHMFRKVKNWLSGKIKNI